MIRKMSWVIWDQDQPHTTGPFDPHLALFTIQPCVALCSPIQAPYTIQGDDFQVQHHKLHQNVQLNQQRKLQQSRPCEHSWHPSLPVIVSQKEQIKALYSDFFEGIGCFPGKPYHINLDQSVTPVQTWCRPVPVHLKEAFKQEINKMLDAGILKPVEKATPWINSFVLVQGKNPDGSIT